MNHLHHQQIEQTNTVPEILPRYFTYSIFKMLVAQYQKTRFCQGFFAKKPLFGIIYDIFFEKYSIGFYRENMG